MTGTARGILIGSLAGAAMVAAVVFRGCDSEPTKVEARVDSTLATVPAWQDTVKARDSVIAVRDRARERERRGRLAERVRADQAEAKADSLQAWADTLAIIPEGTASDSVLHLGAALTAQKKAAAQFKVTVDSLTVHRTADSLRLIEANETIAEMKSWRVQDLARIDTLTADLSDLRAETKHKGDWNVLGVHVPGYVKDVVFVAGAGYAGWRIGRAAS